MKRKELIRNLMTILFVASVAFVGVTSLSADEGAGMAGLAVDSPVANTGRAVGDIIKSFTAPGLGDARGLTFDGTYLWMAEDDTKLIYKIDPAIGEVIASIPTPGVSNTQGLAWDGTHLWHGEYNGMIYQIDPSSGAVLYSFMSPSSRPCGLTWDGTYLWTSSYSDNMIYQFTTTGTVVNSFSPPAGNTWGLAWDGASLWNCNYNAQPVYELNPSSGGVISSFASPAGSWLLGLTFDGSYLWAVDKNANLIYQFNAGLSGDPIPDVKLNGGDGPVFVSSTQPVSLTVSLYPESMAGVNHDWWVIASKQGGGIFSWVFPVPWHWTVGVTRAHAGPLFPINDFVLHSGTIPVGTWTIRFAVDAMDNVYQGTYAGSLKVTSS
jgi:hypothetical protein